MRVGDLEKFSLLFLLLGVSVAGGCGGDNKSAEVLPPGVAAKVGGKSIRETRVRAQLENVYTTQGGTVRTFGPPNYPQCVKLKTGIRRSGETDESIRRQCKVEFDITRAQAVATLIQTEWLAREAKRHGITVAREVHRALTIADKFARAASHKKSRALSPRQRAYIAAQARDVTAYDKLRAAIPLKEEEIASYGAANGDVFLTSEVRTAEIVQTATKAKAVRARQEQDKHVPWRTTQRRYGIKPFAEHWTGHKKVKESTAPTDALGRALFTTKPGKLLGPIHTLNGWFVIEVTKITPPRHRGLTAEAHNTVAKTLRAQKLADILRKRYASRTTCAPKYQIPEAPQCQ